MRLPNTAYTSRPWRIHELTRDFRLEDVWALPTPGGPDDFPRLVEGIASGDRSQGSSRAARTLWAIRWKVGELLGWDGPEAGLGSRVPTLRDRLPVDLRDAPSGPDKDGLRDGEAERQNTRKPCSAYRPRCHCAPFSRPALVYFSPSFGKITWRNSLAISRWPASLG